MKLYSFPASSRVVAINALINQLGLVCQRHTVDLARGDQMLPAFLAINPNHKAPALVDGDFVLWEGNAILAYLAARQPERTLWPATGHAQADVMRWLIWQAAHLDAEAWGMVAFEKNSKAVLNLGEPDPAFVMRGEQNFARFVAVLDQSLTGRRWLAGDSMTIADLAVGQVVPSAARLGLAIDGFPAVEAWYGRMAALPAWQSALAMQAAAMADFIGQAETQQFDEAVTAPGGLR